MTYQDRINAAMNLDDLCATLNTIESEMTTIREENDSASPNTGERIDLADLPTFGGIAPDDTIGIWSWDATRILVADGTQWTIESR